MTTTTHADHNDDCDGDENKHDSSSDNISQANLRCQRSIIIHTSTLSNSVIAVIFPGLSEHRTTNSARASVHFSVGVVASLEAYAYADDGDKTLSILPTYQSRDSPARRPLDLPPSFILDRHAELAEQITHLSRA